MSKITGKGAAAMAVIALCIALNIALALAPKTQEQELPPAPQSRPVKSEEPEAEAEDIPVPEDLPEGSDPAALVTAVQTCLDENGLSGRTSLAIVDSGKSDPIAVGTPQATWWVYEATMPDGSKAQFTAGYNSDAGFYAAMQ